MDISTASSLTRTSTQGPKISKQPSALTAPTIAASSDASAISSEARAPQAGRARADALGSALVSGFSAGGEEPGDTDLIDVARKEVQYGIKAGSNAVDALAPAREKREAAAAAKKKKTDRNRRRRGKRPTAAVPTGPGRVARAIKGAEKVSGPVSVVAGVARVKDGVDQIKDGDVVAGTTDVVAGTAGGASGAISTTQNVKEFAKKRRVKRKRVARNRRPGQAKLKPKRAAAKKAATKSTGRKVAQKLASKAAGRALGGIGVIAEGVGDTVEGIKEGDVEKGAVGAVKSVSGGLMMTGNPVLMGVGAVGYVGALGYENREAIADGAEAVGEAVSNGASAVGEAVSRGAESVGNTVSDGAEAVGDAVSGAIDDVREYFTGD